MPTATTDHRQRVLRALGVVPYALRAQGGAAVREEESAPADGESSSACVLVLPDSCAQRPRRVLARAMQALGADFARAPRLIVSAGELRDPVPHAPVYLAFGETQARALGRSLPTAVMTAAEVLLLEEPQTLLEAAGKRRLWQALHGLRRRRAGVAG